MIQQKMVQDWHDRFQVRIRYAPEIADLKTFRLREALMREELDEFKQAGEDSLDFGARDGISTYFPKRGDEVIPALVKIADSLGDEMYVTLGTAVSYGIDLEPVFAEIHKSNMSKGDPEVKRAPNGKILKSTNWRPPDLDSIILSQINAGSHL